MINRTVAVALTTLSLVAVGGCTSSATTAGGDNAVATFEKITGNLDVTVASSLDNAYSAAKSAIGSMQYTIDQDAKDALQARIVFKEATGKTNTVNIRKTAENVSEIKLNVGAFGDEGKARLIMDEIKRRL